jgi:SpoVK/Ycf46/Vps4 family AAA+-type ATPase
MILTVKKRILEEIGFKKFLPFGVEEDDFSYHRDEWEFDLSRMTVSNQLKLREVFEAAKHVHGSQVFVRDIDTWRTAVDDASSARPRNVKTFCQLLKLYLAKVEGHRIWTHDDDDSDLRLFYYVEEVEYHRKVTHSHSTTPAHTTMDLYYRDLGVVEKDTVTFWDDDCRNMTIQEALLRKGYRVETSESRKEYLAEIFRYNRITKVIGSQYWATGTGDPSLDGNPEDRDSWYRRKKNIHLTRNGQPTRVLIDVFFEEVPDKDRQTHINGWFWDREGKTALDDELIDWASEEEDETNKPIEIPIHPFAAVFDLSKHLRLKVHIKQLTPYEYDEKLSEKLVLRKDLKQLVRMLIEHKEIGFKDIVKGKAGGAVVLLAGPPGVGKTLTAEVYAESEKRALYSIQCSQLGIDAESLEEELLKIFARAHRWNAVMLLDEADVYVRNRGEDLTQNAIVGVFLRVLEYQDSVLFLTTNRPDSVDDAIASRCVARINYPVPNTEEQKMIWRVLANTTEAKITSATIESISKKNPKLTGRDVKNLLKLAMLVKPGEEVSSNTVEFVKGFRP